MTDRFALSAVVARANVKLRRAGKEWKACCPFHPDRTPSFTIYANDRRFMCFGCAKEGDVLDFVRLAYGVSLLDAIRMLDSGALGPLDMPAANAEPEVDRIDEAVTIWNGATAVLGTPAETYLRRRGIICDLPACLRFARLPYGSRGPSHPVLVAAVTLGDDLCGIQRTYLTESGSKAAVAKAKLSLGRIRAGSIKLSPAEDTLVVTEGLEDGLTLVQELSCSVWVAAGTTMMPSMAFPDTVRSIVIGADSDSAGEIAARRAASAYYASGRAVRIMRPTLSYKDFNAELMGAKV
jgi:DNA primase